MYICIYVDMIIQRTSYSFLPTTTTTITATLLPLLAATPPLTAVPVDVDPAPEDARPLLPVLAGSGDC